MSLARRLLLGSVVLALLVTAAFVTLIVAVSSLREANDREARATEAVEATLRLEKLVIDMEFGLRGFALTQPRGLPRAVRERARAAPGSAARSSRQTASDLAQQVRARNARAPDRRVSPRSRRAARSRIARETRHAVEHARS